MVSENSVPGRETRGAPELDFPQNPVGVIRFAGDRSFSIESDTKGSLKVVVGITENCSGLGAGRDYDFGEFKEVAILQANLGSLRVANHPSIRTNTESLFAQVATTNPLTLEHSVFSLGEEKLLDVLTGKTGGLLTFYGDDKPEEVALVIENKSDGNSKASLIFFSSDVVTHRGMDSITGTSTFFADMSVALAGKSASRSFSALRNVRNIYDQLIKKNKITEEGSRRELVRVLLLAHAWGFDRTKGDRHIDFLDAYMPQWREDRLQRAERDFPLSDPIRVNAALNTFIRGKALPTYEDNDDSSQEVDIFQEKDLSVTEKARELLEFFKEQLGDNFGNPMTDHDKRTMGTYLEKVIKLIPSAHLLSDYQGIGGLVEELLDSNYGRNTIFYSKKDWKKYTFLLNDLEIPYSFKNQWGSTITRFSSDARLYVSEVLERIQTHLSEQELRLASEDASGIE